MNKSFYSWSRLTRLFAFISLMFGSVASYGQGNVDGYIVGEVSGASGPVSNATVTATSLDTGATRSMTTSDSGDFRFSRMATGTYEVRVAAPGMGSQVQTVEVNVG
jgi:hypothetical protein